MSPSRTPIRLRTVGNSGQGRSIFPAMVEEYTDTSLSDSALIQEYGDLGDMGVAVPAKVERVVLQNAANVAGLLLTTEAAIVELKEKKRATAGAGAGDDFKC